MFLGLNGQVTGHDIACHHVTRDGVQPFCIFHAGAPASRGSGTKWIRHVAQIRLRSSSSKLLYLRQSGGTIIVEHHYRLPAPTTAAAEHRKKGAPLRTFRGHVSTPLAMMSNPSLFFMQLSDHSYAFWSNNLFLLICPRGVHSIVSSVFNLATLLLSLSGDVEYYPGPSVEECLFEILSTTNKWLLIYTTLLLKSKTYSAMYTVWPNVY